MIKHLIFFLFFYSLTYCSAQEAMAIYGNLWSNQQEMTCNWYFKEKQAVLELIDEKETDIKICFYFTSEDQYLTVVSTNQGLSSTNRIHMDSLYGDLSPLRFMESGSPQNFEFFGSAKRYQSRNTTNESIAFSIPLEPLDLSPLKNKLKNDPVLTWFAANKSKEFPIQYMITQLNGNLLLSYLASSYSYNFDQSIFEP